MLHLDYSFEHGAKTNAHAVKRRCDTNELCPLSRFDWISSKRATTCLAEGLSLGSSSHISSITCKGRTLEVSVCCTWDEETLGSVSSGWSAVSTQQPRAWSFKYKGDKHDECTTLIFHNVLRCLSFQSKLTQRRSYFPPHVSQISPQRNLDAKKSPSRAFSLRKLPAPNSFDPRKAFAQLVTSTVSFPCCRCPPYPSGPKAQKSLVS